MTVSGQISRPPLGRSYWPLTPAVAEVHNTLGWTARFAAAAAKSLRARIDVCRGRDKAGPIVVVVYILGRDMGRPGAGGGGVVVAGVG